MFLHLSVILFTGGVGFLACITGHITRGGLHQGVCLHGGLPPGRVCIEGGLHPGGVGQTPLHHGILWDTVNKRAVRILLVYAFLLKRCLDYCFHFSTSEFN